MPVRRAPQPELEGIGERLTAARRERGLTQAALAARCLLKRQQINFFETGARLPSLGQLLQIARALDLPLQRFLSGSDRPGRELPDLAIELRHLGLIDLWVEAPTVPAAFRRPEEVVALAVAGEEPDPRVVTGLPAVLAWNRWSGALLWAHGKNEGARALIRLAWLADVALAIDRGRGFPGGCRGRKDLSRFVERVKPPKTDRWDGLGKPAAGPQRSPVWKRWRINFADDLAAFRLRAEALVSLREAEGGRAAGDKE